MIYGLAILLANINSALSWLVHAVHALFNYEELEGESDASG